MSKFFKSQVDVVTSQYVIITNGGYSCEASYQGRSKNKPINLDKIVTFTKTEHFESISGGGEERISVQIKYPGIVFHTNEFTNNHQRHTLNWWYPPTTNGLLQRDGDYQFLLDNAVSHCANTPCPAGKTLLEE